MIDILNESVTYDKDKQKRLITAFGFILCTTILIMCISLFNLKNVTIVKDGEAYNIRTYARNVGYILSGSGVGFTENDYVSVNLNEKLKGKNNTIYIRSAVPVTIEADGKKNIYYSYRSQVREALFDCIADFKETDIVTGAALTDSLKEGMNIKVVRVENDTVTTIDTLQKGVHIVNNYNLDYGIENIINPGEDGAIERVYNVTYEDGIVKSKEIVQENVIKQPVDMVIERGSANMKFTSRGESFRYSQVYDMVATCYTLAYDECGKNPGDPGYGITASGLPAARGVIAVNPYEIPYGTRLYIETADGSGWPDYGFAIAGDTGNLMPNSVDLFVDEKSEAFAWGIRKVRVYVLN